MNLGVRVASASVLVVLVAGALWVGGVAVDVLIGAGGLLALYEFGRLMARIGDAPIPWVLYPLGTWLMFRRLLPSDVPALEIGLGAAVVVGLVSALALGQRGALRWAVAVGGALYVGLCLGSYLFLLDWHGENEQHFGLRIVGVLLATAIACDSGALFVGRAVGRTPFFPAISPKKTLEGAIGGGVAAVVVLAIGGTWLLGLHPALAALLGALVAISAQGGDLVESSMKRAAGEKDSGRLIPGHGGLLDRLDSLLLLGPLVYAYLRLAALP